MEPTQNRELQKHVFGARFLNEEHIVQANMCNSKFTTAQSDPKTVLSDPEILAEEKSFTGLNGNTIELTVLRLKTSAGGQRPCIYNIQ